MKPIINNENNIFMATFTGALLFIGAMAVILASVTNAAATGVSYSMGGIMAVSSLSLLYKAIKSDRSRLGN